ncbi:replication initiation regulator SeqA [Aliagarivorans marinus]|uniref:replication initiation regulator SeqA n=1 Tax=Aliagarivorans marinus TaxID=561965 RepID=UPI0004254BED
MKTIEVDDDLYFYIAGQTRYIGESASDILRRLLDVDAPQDANATQQAQDSVAEKAAAEPETAEQKAEQVEQAEQVEAEAIEPAQQPVASATPAQAFDALQEIAELRSSTKRFLALMSRLYAYDADKFGAATEIKGSKRIYFATSKETLLETGKTTKPQAIPETPYFVITNTNTDRKRKILSQVAEQMGLAQASYQDLVDLI